MSVLSEMVATEKSSNIYKGSLVKQNVYYNQMMKTRRIWVLDRGVRIFILPLQPLQKMCMYTKWEGKNGRILCTEKPGRLQSMGLQELDTT